MIESSRAAQQLAAAVEADAADFFGRGAAEVAAELDLEAAARDGDFAEHIVDHNAVKGMRVDVTERADDGVVVDREDVGRLAAHHAVGRNEHGLLWRGLAADHAIEHGGGFVAEALAGDGNARKRRRRDFAEQVVGIAGEDGDFVRDADAGEVADFGELAAAVGVDGEDGDRPRQRGEPAIDAALLFFEADLTADAVAGLIVVAFVALGGDGFDERFAALARVAMARRSEVGELAEAAGDEMFDGEARAFGFVGEHRADAIETVVDVVDVDDRDALLAELLHLLAARDAGDDAVAAPTIGNGGALFVIARVDQADASGRASRRSGRCRE